MDFTLDKLNANEPKEKKKQKNPQKFPKHLHKILTCAIYSILLWQRACQNFKMLPPFTLTCFKYFIIFSENE